jgi:Ferredoxin-thioredoxin reductase, catalytic subunit
MNEQTEISQEEIDKFYGQLKKDAVAGGYNLNPDIEFTRSLVRGLLTNQKRYGYPACPCRLASGVKKEDIDIICPVITGMPILLIMALVSEDCMWPRRSLRENRN